VGVVGCKSHPMSLAPVTIDVRYDCIFSLISGSGTEPSHSESASPSCDTQTFLADFAESNQLTEEVMQKAKEYLGHVRTGW